MSERRRVLIVDDNEAFLALVSGEIAEMGYQVDTAADGEDAVAKIEKTRPDFVLLDMFLPRCDGVEVLSRLKPAALAKTKIFLCTLLREDRGPQWQDAARRLEELKAARPDLAAIKLEQKPSELKQIRAVFSTHVS